MKDSIKRIEENVEISLGNAGNVTYKLKFDVIDEEVLETKVDLNGVQFFIGDRIEEFKEDLEGLIKKYFI